MGNCLRNPSSMTWAGDDWDPTESDRPFAGKTQADRRNDNVRKVEEMEEERLIPEKNGVSSTEVKIKLTKKQMEEVLVKVSIQGMSIEKLLTQLMNECGECHQLRQRSWRPALQSIPEVN